MIARKRIEYVIKKDRRDFRTSIAMANPQRPSAENASQMGTRRDQLEKVII